MSFSRTLLAAAIAALVPAVAASAATVTIGYTNVSGGSSTGSPIGGPYQSAASAQASFLSTLGTTYVEDFQDWTVNSTVGNNKALTFSGMYEGVVKVSASNGQGNKTVVNKGLLSNWGDFGGLASTSASDNIWLGVQSTTLTLTFESLVTNVGFLINDARDLGSGLINITYVDGTSTNLSLASLGASNGNLPNQNLYFIGLNDEMGIKSIAFSGASSSDGFGIDDLVIGSSLPSPGPGAPIPLPPAAWAGLVLTGLAAAHRKYKNRVA